MNAPLDPALRQVTLEDKYEADSGAVYITGTQALVRLPLMQRRRDVAAGLNTAGYLSGYRGSPVGGYDQALLRARKHLEQHHVKFVPGVNEDLAATALWGTQQLNLFPGGKYDGVFGIWYGKGPGVDRSGDALRHANQAGTARHGGVLALAGDDHGAKSSTMAAQTDFIFQAVSIPVLAPATVQDYIDLGLLGFEMSRYTGLWVGFKAVTDTIEVAGIADVSPDRIKPVTPDGFVMPEGGLNLRWPEEPFLKMEERLTRWKIPAALAWARANRLDRNVFGRADGEPARLGIVSTGKSWLDTMQALAELGIDEATARAIGLKVYKVAMPWPLEPEGIRAFCEGCAEVLVIEEKRSLIEAQLREQLYPLAQRPLITGKVDENGALLLPEWGELSPAICARTIVARLRRWAEAGGNDARGGSLTEALARSERRLAEIAAREQALVTQLPSISRIPYFCSGCPHNTSTRVPEGSRALAGIGCHYMSQWMDRSTDTFTHMGAEGTNWVGQFPFTETRHVFQNLGDGTYFHSGSLAIRQAVAAKAPMTYKILFNDAVAMTGGQKHDGELSPRMIARQVAAEGVEKVVVVTDEPGKYPAGYFDSSVGVYHRSRLDEVQRELREYPGVSVLIYDQTCAAEKRRRRKRGEFPDPARRVFINEAVCEGCGDCGVKSNCVSVEPVETEFGRKRKINQSSCNKDYSCVDGFCPSFVSVNGGKLRRLTPVSDAKAAGGQAGQGETAPATRKTSIAQSLAAELPAATLPAVDGAYSMLVTGIGGTGVVTIGALLGMAAHLEGKNVTVLDVTGLAQKNGAVLSYIRFGAPGEPLYAPRVGAAAADAVLGCDIVVTAGNEALLRMIPGRTRAVVNVASTPTAEFTRNADWKFPLGEMETAVVEAVGDRAAVDFLDGQRLATALLGDAIATNLFMLGYAWQRGLVPVSAAAIERAIELNGVAIDQNRNAFAWGRVAAVDLERVERAATPATAISIVRKPAQMSLDELIAHRTEFLTGYQNARYAKRYTDLVAKVRDAEKRVAGEAGALKLTEAVARYFAKLMAYKDEYEVARLYTNGGFAEKLKQQFDGDYTLSFHLAPPLVAKRNAKGELIKKEYGPWVFKLFGILARLKGLRGTPLDVFGRTDERREERALIDEYQRTIEGLLDRLNHNNLAIAVQIASVPEKIRGFGHVKARNLAAAVRHRTELLQAFDSAQPLRSAA
ncbi:MAG: indolepyruvate ferredoxin oxidoreductase family protein [Burkholderiaceae bacterium]